MIFEFLEIEKIFLNFLELIITTSYNLIMKEVNDVNIKWFSSKEKIGSASFYNTNITLNTIASIPFEYAYRVQVGIDEKNNVVIQPLPKDKVMRGDLDEYTIYQIAIKKTYSRISSTSLMKKIGEALGIEFSNEPTKFETYWEENENVLIIKTEKGVTQ